MSNFNTAFFEADPKSVKYLAYVRKSTEETDRQVMSIEAQIDAIRKQYSGLDITFITDDSGTIGESMSAAKPGRPLFNKMISMLESGEYQGIVAWHPDRLSRNAPDAARVVWDIQGGYIKDLKFCNFTFEPTPEGIMMLQMIMSQAQYFSAKLSKDVRRGNAQKRKNGGITYRAPMGYINNRVEKTIEPDPERFDLLVKAFRLMLTGSYSVGEIARIMNDDWGFTSRKTKRAGGCPISVQGLYKAFNNPIYAGIIIDPHTKEEFKAQHKPMITPEEFHTIKSLLARRGMPKNTPRRGHTFPLKGAMRCGECGCAITAEMKRKVQKNGNVHIYHYYRCTHKSQKTKCHQPAIREEKLQEQFDDLLDQYELSPQLYEWGLQAIKELSQKEIAERDSVQQMQNKAIQTTQNQLDRLLDLLTDNIISIDQYQKKTAQLKDRLEHLQEEQKEAANRSRNWYEIVGTALARLTNARDNFAKGSIEEKMCIMEALGSDPVLTDGRLSIKEYFWLKPIKNGKKMVMGELDQVRTAPEQRKNASEEAAYQHWCGYRESDPDLILGKDT